jgi:hypothetical protein
LASGTPADASAGDDRFAEADAFELAQRLAVRLALTSRLGQDLRAQS